MKTLRVEFISFSVLFLLLISVVNLQAEMLLEQDPDWGRTYSTAIMQLADDFSIELGATISGLGWSGGYSAYGGVTEAMVDNFTVRFYSDINGLPGDILVDYSGAITGSVSRDIDESFALAYPLYNYEFFLPDPFVVEAGATYWFSVYNDPIENGEVDEWAWHKSSGEINRHAYVFPESNPVWGIQEENNLAFTLTGTPNPVPEPSTFLLLGSGLVGLLWCGFKRKNA